MFIAAAILAVIGQSVDVRYLLSGYGVLVACRLCIGMVGDIFHGRYGVDILAVLAIGRTLWVGKYWATIVSILIMEGDQALEAFAGMRAKADLSALLERSPTSAHKPRRVCQPATFMI